MGIAKSAQQQEPVTIEHKELSPSIDTLSYADVPIDIYRFFSLDMANTDSKILDKLKHISNWTFKDAETLGDGLKKLRDLEIQLGTPRLDEDKTEKIYRWIKMQAQIDDIRKRQESL